MDGWVYAGFRDLPAIWRLLPVTKFQTIAAGTGGSTLCSETRWRTWWLPVRDRRRCWHLEDLRMIVSIHEIVSMTIFSGFFDNLLYYW